jgi:hypothetical protein
VTRVAAAAAGMAVLLLAPGAAGAGAAAEPVLTLTDPAITESSGLVVDDASGERLLVTTNDSGDTGRVFTVDAATGDTVGVTTWSTDPVDVEALAPAGPGEVWVADIGDNDAERSSVSIARVPVGRGERTAAPLAELELTYPDGPRDAETLLVDPDGRVLVVTKGLLGGEFLRSEVAAADAGRSGTLALSAVGEALPIATDGAFLPDGRHLVVRSYGSAVVYAYPSLEAVGSLRLPPQRQGEGIAADGAGAVLLSSEGVGSEVLRVRLPRDLRRAMAPEVPDEPEEAAPSDPPPGPSAEPEPDDGLPALLGVVAAGLGVLLLTLVLRRPRRPRG